MKTVGFFKFDTNCFLPLIHEADFKQIYALSLSLPVSLTYTYTHTHTLTHALSCDVF